MTGEVATKAVGKHLKRLSAPVSRSVRVLRSLFTLKRTDRKIYKMLEPEFDGDYYSDVNGDVDPHIDLLEHYIKIGWKESRDPSAWFSTAGYLRNNPDVHNAGVNPFFHYVAFGRAEGRAALPPHAVRRPRRQGGSASKRERSQSQKETERATAVKAASLFGFDKEAEEALEGAGFYSRAVLPMFSPADYRFAAREEQHSRSGCVKHFATRGHRELAPISYELEFDPDFYREYAGLAEGYTAVDAYRHWLTEGVRRGLPPNSRRLFGSLGFVGEPHHDAFNVKTYLANNPQLAAETSSYWPCLEHFVTAGTVGVVPGCPLTSKTLDLYSAAAEYAAVHGRKREAQNLYELLLDDFPRDRTVLINLANLLFEEKQYAAAAELYRRAIADGQVTIGAHLNRALCLFAIGATRGAIEATEVGISAFPEDYGLRLKRVEWLSRAFEESHAHATVHARAGKRTEVGRVMIAAAAELSAAWEPASFATPTRRAIPKVAIFADLNLPQCRFYRVDQKVEQFAEIGITAEVFKFLEGFEALAARLYEFDVLIFYRVPGWNEVFELISRARQLGIPTVYEVDDLVFDVEHFPEPLEQYEGLINDTTHASLMVGSEVYRGAMRACDYGVASTATLARHMEPAVRTGRVFVHPNALGSTHLAAMASNLKRSSSERVTLFFGSGTKAHKSDFARIAAPALARLFTKYGDGIRLRMTGFQHIPPVLTPFERYISCDAPEWRLQKYWNILSCCDINLAVLSRSESTDSKSEIKWLEAGMLGIPSVVSRNPTYEACIEDGVTGFLATTPEEWYIALDKLVADAALRERVGQASREAISARYAPRVMADNLARMIEEVSPSAALPSRRKRILIVNVFYAPQAIGGATRVVGDNVRDLLSGHGDSFEVEVFAGVVGDPHSYRVRSYAHDGVRVTTVTSPPEPDVESRALDPKMENIFAKFVAARRPDLIHFHCIQRLTASLALVAKDLGVPYLVTAHDGWWISPRQFLVDEFGRLETYPADSKECVRRYGEGAAARARILRSALSGAKYVLAVSEPFAQIYRAAGVDNVRAVANGVSALPPIRRAPPPDGRVRLGYLGGLELHKGYPLVRAAFSRSRYSNLSLTIVDHTQDAGRERRETWGETPVTFVGKRSQDEVGFLYGSLDVLLAPSIWPESYGLAVREALHYGLWVIASDRGATGGDIIEGKNGFIISVDKADGLRRVLRMIDASPNTYKERPKATARLRTSAEQADDLARIYRQILCD